MPLPQSLPYGMEEVLQSLDLPSPFPLPLDMLDLPSQAMPGLFTLGPFPKVGSVSSPTSLASLDHIFGPEGVDGGGEGMRCAGFGMDDGGLQDRRFVYLLAASSLRLGLSLPWGNVYGDEGERADMEQAFRLVRACLGNAPDSGRLSVYIDAQGCAWKHEDGGAVRQGDDLGSLLDVLTLSSGGEAGLSAQWLRV